ncbi:MAG: glycosyltransferase family A protein [Flavobacteriaceae bacterium]
MKAKEIPTSIYHTVRLLAIPSKKLANQQRQSLPIIISLTSIPSRLRTLHIVIRSLLTQKELPKRIVLWLHSDLKESLPPALTALEGSIFQIKYSPLTCSHRKLIHALEAFPNDIVITCDDDMIYRDNWTQRLYAEHLAKPHAILANQTRYLQLDGEGNAIPYREWVYRQGAPFYQERVVPIGAGGVLYPPRSLDSQCTDSKLFLELAPKADDLWFKTMALLKGTLSYQVPNAPKPPIPIFGSQRESLKKTNIAGEGNQLQWRALSNYFDLPAKLKH